MNTLKILSLGDAHFESKNIREINIFLDKLKNYIENNLHDIDYFCILGDTLHEHERLHVSPLNKAIEYIKLLASYKKTYVLVGNHDMNNQSAFLTAEHWLNCLKPYENVIIVDDILVENLKGHRIIFAPYVPQGRVLEALTLKDPEWTTSKCIFAHWDIRGANMGSIIAKDADEWKPDYPMLISGHIHLSQWLGENMYYTGSIMQVAVDESSKKHISSVIINYNKLPSIHEIDLKLPKKEIIHIDVDDVDDFQLPDEQETKYTLYISGSYEEFKSFRKSNYYRELLKQPQLIKIRFKPKKIETKEKIKNIETLRSYQQKSFHELLSQTIGQENDQLLQSFYNHIVLNDSEDLSDKLDEILILS